VSSTLNMLEGLEKTGRHHCVVDTGELGKPSHGVHKRDEDITLEHSLQRKARPAMGVAFSKLANPMEGRETPLRHKRTDLQPPVNRTCRPDMFEPQGSPHRAKGDPLHMHGLQRRHPGEFHDGHSTFAGKLSLQFEFPQRYELRSNSAPPPRLEGPSITENVNGVPESPRGGVKKYQDFGHHISQMNDVLMTVQPVHLRAASADRHRTDPSFRSLCAVTDVTHSAACRVAGDCKMRNSGNSVKSAMQWDT